MANYGRALRMLRTLPGFSHKQILRAECGSILKAWAGRTKVSTEEEALWRARFRAGKRAFGDVSSIDRNPYGISVNTGLRGGYPGEVWYRHPVSKKFQQAGVINDHGGFTPAWIHWKSAAWSGILEGSERYATELKGQLILAPKTVGFARQSVVQIADDLGIDLNKVNGGGINAKGLAKARAAIASNGRAYKNGSGTQSGDEQRFLIRLTNNLPFAIKAKMDRDILGIMRGRAKFIETAYRKGAMRSAGRVAKSFPNLCRVRDRDAYESVVNSFPESA
jgi:hypothetical protein